MRLSAAVRRIISRLMLAVLVFSLPGAGTVFAQVEEIGARAEISPEVAGLVLAAPELQSASGLALNPALARPAAAVAFSALPPALASAVIFARPQAVQPLGKIQKIRKAVMGALQGAASLGRRLAQLSKPGLVGRATLAARQGFDTLNAPKARGGASVSAVGEVGFVASGLSKSEALAAGKTRSWIPAVPELASAPRFKHAAAAAVGVALIWLMFHTGAQDLIPHAALASFWGLGIPRPGPEENPNENNDPHDALRLSPDRLGDIRFLESLFSDEDPTPSPADLDRFHSFAGLKPELLSADSLRQLGREDFGWSPETTDLAVRALMGRGLLVRRSTGRYVHVPRDPFARKAARYMNFAGQENIRNVAKIKALARAIYFLKRTKQSGHKPFLPFYMNALMELAGAVVEPRDRITAADLAYTLHDQGQWTSPLNRDLKDDVLRILDERREEGDLSAGRVTSQEAAGLDALEELLAPGESTGLRGGELLSPEAVKNMGRRFERLKAHFIKLTNGYYLHTTFHHTSPHPWNRLPKNARKIMNVSLTRLEDKTQESLERAFDGFQHLHAHLLNPSFASGLTVEERRALIEEIASLQGNALLEMRRIADAEDPQERQKLDQMNYAGRRQAWILPSIHPENVSEQMGFEELVRFLNSQMEDKSARSTKPAPAKTKKRTAAPQETRINFNGALSDAAWSFLRLDHEFRRLAKTDANWPKVHDERDQAGRSFLRQILTVLGRPADVSSWDIGALHEEFKLLDHVVSDDPAIRQAIIQLGYALFVEPFMEVPVPAIPELLPSVAQQALFHHLLLEEVGIPLSREKERSLRQLLGWDEATTRRVLDAFVNQGLVVRFSGPRYVPLLPFSDLAVQKEQAQRWQELFKTHQRYKSGEIPELQGFREILALVQRWPQTMPAEVRAKTIAEAAALIGGESRTSPSWYTFVQGASELQKSREFFESAPQAEYVLYQTIYFNTIMELALRLSRLYAKKLEKSLSRIYYDGRRWVRVRRDKEVTISWDHVMYGLLELDAELERMPVDENLINHVLVAREQMAQLYFGTKPPNVP